MEQIQRRAATQLLSGFTGLLVVLLTTVAFWGDEWAYLPNLTLMSVSMLILTLLHRSGWEPARFCVIVLIDGVTVTTLPIDTEYLAVVVPVLVTWALADWRWLLASSIGVYGGVMLRSGFTGPYTASGAIVTYVMIVGGLLVGSHVLSEALTFAKKGYEVEAMRATTVAFAHQINQPLTAALGYIQLLQSTPRNECDDADLLSIRCELERIAMLVREFNATRTFTTQSYANTSQMLTLHPEDSNDTTSLYQ